MSEIMYRQATPQDVSAVTALALLLFEGSEYDILRAEFAELLTRADAAVFLAEKDNEAVGFAQCQLRRDYVEGTQTSPVGYLEGVYVRPALRQTGVARSMVERGQAWAKALGCSEFASDCELSNETSAAFHKALGFAEAAKIIHFVKAL